VFFFLSCLESGLNPQIESCKGVIIVSKLLEGNIKKCMVIF
jgi:hypothetical protein